MYEWISQLWFRAGQLFTIVYEWISLPKLRAGQLVHFNSRIDRLFGFNLNRWVMGDRRLVKFHEN